MGGKALYDGISSFWGGASFGLQPSLIRDDQIWNGINLTVRGGYATTRPGWIKRELSFSSPEAKNRFLIGNPQGIGFYQTGEGYLIPAIDGRIFAIDVLAGFKGQDITPSTGPNAKNVAKSFMSQWENFFIIQDGQSSAIYLKGLTASRSTGDKSIPVGTAMAYGWGRGWVTNGTQIAAGDIKDGFDENGVLNPSSVITFSESTFLNEGGSFNVPATMGQINALAFIPLQDTATGQGSLLVGADLGVSSIAGGIPRSQWKSTQIQQVALLDAGMTSQDGNILLNGDIFFRSYDGVRSYRMARAQQGINGQTPQSQEVYPYVSTDTQSYLRYCSGVNFDGRILMTTAPVWNGTFCYWKGLVVLDSYPTSSLFGQATPVWEGMWDGLNIVQIITGVFNKETRCFALIRKIDDTIVSTIQELQQTDDNLINITVNDSSVFAVDGIYQSGSSYIKVLAINGDFSIAVVIINGPNTSTSLAVGATIIAGEYNELWELSKNEPFDIVDNDKIRIKSQLWSKSYSFGNPLGSKKILQYNMWVDDVIGQVDWTLTYRPDQYPCFLPWTTGSLCQENETCGEVCPTSLQRNPSYKPRISIGKPPVICNTVAGGLTENMYESQVILEWEGHMRVRAIRLTAQDSTDPTRADPC